MNICEETEEVTKFVPGRLYKRATGRGYKSGEVFLCSTRMQLVCTYDGIVWGSARKGSPTSSPDSWTDVTDQYCLKRVK